MKRRYLPFDTCAAIERLPSMADAVWTAYKKPKLKKKIGYFYKRHRTTIARSFKHWGIMIPGAWHILDNKLPRAERQAVISFITPETELLDAKRTAALPHRGGQWPVVGR